MQVHCVRGSYLYYHYLQDGIRDNVHSLLSVIACAVTFLSFSVHVCVRRDGVAPIDRCKRLSRGSASRVTRTPPYPLTKTFNELLSRWETSQTHLSARKIGV